MTIEIFEGLADLQHCAEGLFALGLTREQIDSFINRAESREWADSWEGMIPEEFEGCCANCQDFWSPRWESFAQEMDDRLNEVLRRREKKPSKS